MERSVIRGRLSRITLRSIRATKLPRKQRKQIVKLACRQLLMLYVKAWFCLEGFPKRMCGIIAILGTEPVALGLVEALKRLEYRGYDSAGVATLEQGLLTRRRAEGKLKNLDKRP